MVYASLGLTGVVFLVHGLYLWEFAIQRKRLSLEMMILMAALNLVGALLYATRVSTPFVRTHSDNVVLTIETVPGVSVSLSFRHCWCQSSAVPSFGASRWSRALQSLEQRISRGSWRCLDVLRVELRVAATVCSSADTSDGRRHLSGLGSEFVGNGSLPVS